MTIELPMPPGVLLATPGLLTCHIVLDVRAPPDDAFAKTSFVAGIRSVGGVNIITTIPRFIDGDKTGMVRKLNNFC